MKRHSKLLDLAGIIDFGKNKVFDIMFLPGSVTSDMPANVYI
jgi:hypothetical protein